MIPMKFDDKDLAIIVIAVMGIVSSFITKSTDGFNIAIGAIAGMATGRNR